MPRRLSRHVKLTLKDGAGTPQELELTFDGEVNWSGGGHEKVRIRDRHAKGEVMDGDEKPYPLSFRVKDPYVLSDTGAGEDLSVYEFLTRTGNGSALTSVGPAGEAYAVNAVVEITNPDTSGKDETLTFGEFRMHENGWSEDPEGNGFEFSGEAETMTPARA